MYSEREKILNKIYKDLEKIPSIYILYKLENYIECV
ncbi:hypothetical protein Q604_UNBC09886G0009, partial [human gut metagenome]